MLAQNRALTVVGCADVLERILFLACTVGNHVGPPKTLPSLALVSRSFHNITSANSNPRFNLKLFRHSFEAELEVEEYTDSRAAANLLPRIWNSLRRFRVASYPGNASPPNNLSENDWQVAFELLQLNWLSTSRAYRQLTEYAAIAQAVDSQLAGAFSSEQTVIESNDYYMMSIWLTIRSGFKNYSFQCHDLSKLQEIFVRGVFSSMPNIPSPESQPAQHSRVANKLVAITRHIEGPKYSLHNCSPHIVAVLCLTSCLFLPPSVQPSASTLPRHNHYKTSNALAESNSDRVDSKHGICATDISGTWVGRMVVGHFLGFLPCSFPQCDQFQCQSSTPVEREDDVGIEHAALVIQKPLKWQLHVHQSAQRTGHCHICSNLGLSADRSSASDPPLYLPALGIHGRMWQKHLEERWILVIGTIDAADSEPATRDAASPKFYGAIDPFNGNVIILDDAGEDGVWIFEGQVIQWRSGFELAGTCRNGGGEVTAAFGLRKVYNREDI